MKNDKGNSCFYKCKLSQLVTYLKVICGTNILVELFLWKWTYVCLFWLFFIGIYLLYNVVSVCSTVSGINSMYTYMPSLVSLPPIHSISFTLNFIHTLFPCLENSMDRGAWWATVNGVPESWTKERYAHNWY